MNTIQILIDETGAQFKLENDDLMLFKIVDKKKFFFFIEKITDNFGFDINKEESVSEFYDIYGCLLNKKQGININHPQITIILRKAKIERLLKNIKC